MLPRFWVNVVETDVKSTLPEIFFAANVDTVKFRIDVLMDSRLFSVESIMAPLIDVVGLSLAGENADLDVMELVSSAGD